MLVTAWYFTPWPSRLPRPRSDPAPPVKLAIGLIVWASPWASPSFAWDPALLRLVGRAADAGYARSVTLHLNEGLYKVFEPPGTVTMP